MLHQMVLLVVYQIFKELKPNLIKFLQKIKEKGTHVNSFYEVSITTLTKPEKDMMRKENYKQYH